MSGSKGFRSALAASICLVATVAVTAAPAQAQAGSTQTYDIPAGDLGKALKAFSARSGTRLIFRTDELRGGRTRGLSGRHGADEALQALLAGSGFVARRGSSGALAVVRGRATGAPGESEGRAGTDGGLSREPPRAEMEALSGKGPAESDAADGGEAEIVVTGTNIRGAAPAGSKVTVLDRSYIEQSGFGKIEDIIKSLPQNFSVGANERIGTDSGAANYNRGLAVDLRGLGASSTLVLVNGHRQASGGTEGSIVDIASIPAALVERIEVLPEGASAIYGSDAIGGVVNFVLRKDFKGAETSIRLGTTDGHADEVRLSQLFGTHWNSGGIVLGYQYLKQNPLPADAAHYTSANRDLRRFGGSDFRPLRGNPGDILNSSGVAVYGIPTGQNGVGLTAAQLLPGQFTYEDQVTGVDALPQQVLHAGFAFVRQELGSRAELFFEGRYGKRNMRRSSEAIASLLSVPRTNPFYVNPFGGTGNVLVGYDFIDDLGNTVQTGETETWAGTVGLNGNLGSGWKVSASASLAREHNLFHWENRTDSARVNAALADSNPATALNVFGDGSYTNPATLAGLRSTEIRRSTSQVDSVNLTLDGPLFELPGGTAKLAVGVDYRDENLKAERGNLVAATNIFTRSTSSVGTLDRQVAAAFAELSLPLLDTGRQRISVSLAGRYEDYSDFGDTFNPKAGISWTLFDRLTLRGTWGSSFRAPRFNEISPAVNPPFANLVSNVADPQSPTQRSNILQFGGYNADLHQETADAWTAGADLDLRALGLRASVTFFNYDYVGKIAAPPSSSLILSQEAQWAQVILRNPTQSQVEAICKRPDFTGGCPPAASIAAIVDRRLLNLGGLTTNGIDFDLTETLHTGVGNLTLSGAGTYIFTYKTRVTANAAIVDVVNNVLNPPHFRGRGSLGWSSGGAGLLARVNYLGKTYDPAAKRSIDSWTTVDLSVHYDLGEGAGVLRGLRLSFNVNNLFDTPPPFINQSFAFDPGVGNEAGRTMSLQISKRW